ncbi:MAG: hypothetical protein IJ717_00955 [Treponema sp.]|nr:hypothetical protein [Treponema sp.]
MWDFFSSALNGSNGKILIAIVVLAAVYAAVLVWKGELGISTAHLKIGGESRDSYYERTIVRNQIQAAHDYCRSLEGKIAECTESLDYGGYFTKYILERVYDKIIEWITFNHIEKSDGYIECKQREIKNLVYSFPVKDEFKTESFERRMDKWVAEMIDQLLDIRTVYTKQKSK